MRQKLISLLSLRIVLFCLAAKFLFVVFYRLRSASSSSLSYKLEKPKTILIWNSAHRIETSAFGVGHEAFINASCPVNNCIIYTAHSTLPLNDYDAIIFHMHDPWLTTRPNFQQRLSNQRFIFLSQESPGNLHAQPSEFGGFFNWTMTYRRNSEIPLIYGRIKQKTSAPKTQAEVQQLQIGMHDLSKTNYAAGKSKLAAWMVSHCGTHGKRESYVRELEKSVEVDIFGGCASRYKFYLSFENSICRDYVTEKFFNILQHNIVPIVYGGANYSEIAPPHSYINALDYTPKALAEYLKLLDANDTLYNEYFWWKEQSGVYNMSRHAFCDLCQKLHQDDQVKIYENLVPEWRPSAVCRTVESWETS